MGFLDKIFGGTDINKSDNDFPKVVSWVNPLGQKMYEGTAIGSHGQTHEESGHPNIQSLSYHNYIKDGKWTFYYGGGIGLDIKSYEGLYKNDKQDGLWTTWFANGQKMLEETYKDGELISEVDFLKERIIELLKEKAIKIAVSDIDAHLKFKDIDIIKEKCEEMYQNDDISFAGNGRYFILTEEQEKPKKTSGPKSEEVDVEKETGET